MKLNRFTKLLEGHPLTLATVDNNSRPNIAIVADVKVVSDNQLLIAHNEMIKTIENIKQNKSICLTCFDPDWKGVRVYGTAEYFTSGEYFERVIELFKTEKNVPQGAILINANYLNEME